MSESHLAADISCTVVVIFGEKSRDVLCRTLDQK